MNESHHGLDHSISRAAGVSVLTLRGEIDLATGQPFSVQLDEALSAGDSLVVVDMVNIDFLGSVGLATLIRFQDAAERQGVDVRLVCGPATRRTIELTGLTEKFTLSDSVATAAGDGRAAAEAP